MKITGFIHADILDHNQKNGRNFYQGRKMPTNYRPRLKPDYPRLKNKNFSRFCL